MLEKLQHWYRALPDKKRYLEFITALLTIPVLLTVAISNILSLQNRNQQTPVSTAPATVITIIQPTLPPSTPTPTPTITPTPTPTATPTPTPTPTTPTPVSTSSATLQ